MTDNNTTAREQTFFVNGVERLLRTVPQESGGFMGEVWVQIYDYEFWCPWLITETANLTQENAEYMIDIHDRSMSHAFPTEAINDLETFYESY